MARVDPVLREMGVEGMEELAEVAWGGQTISEYKADLHWPAAYDVYDEMRRRDPTLRSIVHVTKLLAKTATWKAETATDRPGDRQAGEFLESCLEDMSHTVSDWIDDAFTALPFGWSSSEIVYKRREDGRIGWRKLAFRRQSSWDGWIYDETGGFQGWHQRAAPAYQRVELPSEKLIHVIFERDGGRPEGMSIFESGYEPWRYVTNLQLISGIGWQRSFVGLPVFKYEQQPSDSDNTQVSSIGQGLRVGSRQFVGVPPGIDFKLETADNSGAAALLSEIQYFRTLMAQLILADFVMLGMGGGGGGYALGSDKSMMFLMAVDGFLDRVAEAWNRFGVQRLFGYNRFAGMTAVPKLTHTAIRKVRLGDIGAFVQQIGPWIPLTHSDATWVRDQAGMPKPPEGAEVIKPGSPSGGADTPSAPGRWEYPEERAPVGMSEGAPSVGGAAPPAGSPTATTARHGKSVAFAEGFVNRDAEDIGREEKAEGEEAIAGALERYWSGLRRRVQTVVSDQ